VLSVALLILFFIGQATGISAFAEERQCERPCPGESPGGHLPLSCRVCVCCPAAQPAVLSRPAVCLSNEVCRAVIGERIEKPSAPEPREILHVPKRSLA
jgi:hypothetical protein